ncbi:MAG: gamma-carotene 1'-hydroxylase CruF [Pseudanabaenaceae cyanobacterium]
MERSQDAAAPLPRKPLPGWLGSVQQAGLWAHIASMVFGLAGLLWVLPNTDFVARLSPLGMQVFAWGMSAGGATYIVLGAVAVALYGGRTYGWRGLLGFALPAIALSLGSELLGTSTGFPFGHYSYLSGLGYKIAGRVPFTIPLSWFYLGFSTYILARAGLAARGITGWPQKLGAIALGAILLTAWDLVLDPAMSQAPYPFWEFQDAGEFFGMPYRNLTGWIGTGALFMTVGTLLWPEFSPPRDRAELTFPLVIYLVNFAFGAAITLTQLDSGFVIPASLGVLFGVVPAIVLWQSVPGTRDSWLTPLGAGLSLLLTFFNRSSNS